jgi:cyclopropane fatty-acyl-phospholipid synthase-like methyltransferase
MKPARLTLVALWTVSTAASSWCGLRAQEATDEPAVPAQVEAPSQERADEIPPPLTEYLGRRIAPTMHFSHSAWLIREDRDVEENAKMMMEALGVQPGQTVCDLGCGNGYHTLKLAELVGREGKVLAVDIQQEMLDQLAERAKRKGLENVERILGTVVDPKLPAECVDLVLMVDVYHEFSHPEHMLRAIHRSLAEDGRLVLVEFRAEDPEVPILPLHKMSREQILKEMEANGFQLVDEFNELPWQHLLFFGK